MFGCELLVDLILMGFSRAGTNCLPSPLFPATMPPSVWTISFVVQYQF
jgi:hypothetical protein